MKTIAAPVIYPALLLAISVTLAVCSREPSVGAREKEPQPAGVRDAGPLSKRALVHVLDIRNLRKQEANSPRFEPFMTASETGSAALKGKASQNAPPMPALFAEPMNTQWREPPAPAPRGPAIALTRRPQTSVAALREAIHPTIATNRPEPVITAMRSRAEEMEELDLRRQEAELLTIFADEHPKVIAVRTRLAQLAEGRFVQAKRPVGDGSEQSEPNLQVEPYRPEARPQMPLQQIPPPVVTPAPTLMPAPTPPSQPQLVPGPTVQPMPQLTPPPAVQPQPAPKEFVQPSVRPMQQPQEIVHEIDVIVPPQNPAKKDLKTLPAPQPLFKPLDVAEQEGLKRKEPVPLGADPIPSKDELKRFSDFIDRIDDATNTLDLIQNRSRLMHLKATPKRIQISDESIVNATLFGATELTLLGKAQGTTDLNLWFPDAKDKNKDVVLRYLVRVYPDPREKQFLKAMLRSWEVDINRTFHDSVIHLELVGDKVVVTGQAHDINDATQILKVLVANTQNVPALQGTTQGTQGVAGSGGYTRQTAQKIPADTVQNVPRPEAPNSQQGATPGQENYLPSGSPNVINMMTVPGVQQVMLKVLVAEVNRTAARSIGLNFSFANSHGSISNLTGGILGTNGNGGAFGNAGAIGAAGNSGLNGLEQLANIPVSLSNGQVTLAINALKSMHYAKSLAEPNLVASNGQSANFQAGGQFPVPVVAANSTAGVLQSVSFVPYGVQLNFTPYITDKNRIRLNVSATVSTRDTTIGTQIGTSQVAGLNSRNFTSTVDLREGQTLAVAGLLQTNLGADRDNLPFLAEIPFINRFTGFDRTSAGEQELVILITPELVQPMKKGAERPRLPGSDYFDPSDREFYLCGRLEGLRMTEGGFRSPVMNDHDRIREYNRCERNYIFGPSGFVTPGTVK